MRSALIAVVLVLVTAICVLGCSNEVLDALQVHGGGCPMHSNSAKVSPHDCFHKALTSAQEAGISLSIHQELVLVHSEAIAIVPQYVLESFHPALSPPGLTTSISILRI